MRGVGACDQAEEVAAFMSNDNHRAVLDSAGSADANPRDLAGFRLTIHVWCVDDTSGHVLCRYNEVAEVDGAGALSCTTNEAEPTVQSIHRVIKIIAVRWTKAGKKIFEHVAYRSWLVAEREGRLEQR